jgi:hypothetical protein
MMRVVEIVRVCVCTTGTVEDWSLVKNCSSNTDKQIETY